MIFLSNCQVRFLLKNSSLVTLDWVFGFFIIPLIFIIKGLKIGAFFYNKSVSSGVLIIKFLGSGNLIAIREVITSETYIITAKSNFSAINKFLKHKKAFYIDDSNFFSLLTTSIFAIFFILNKRFARVVNLETESKFAKLLSCIARSEENLGLTNQHRSYLDKFLYDRYLVNPLMVSRADCIKLLTKFELKTNVYTSASIQESQNNFLTSITFKSGISKIVFAPTGSDTNNLRRVDANVWKNVLIKLYRSFAEVEVYFLFPDSNDFQYQSIRNSLSLFKTCKFEICNYDNYLYHLRNCDLIICIDSQTLHIASVFKIPTICFFGPTNPYSVNSSNFIYPISHSPMCSPCMHRYFKSPCDQKAPCMLFQDEDLAIFDSLKKLCK